MRSKVTVEPIRESGVDRGLDRSFGTFGRPAAEDKHFAVDAGDAVAVPRGRWLPGGHVGHIGPDEGGGVEDEKVVQEA